MVVARLPGEHSVKCGETYEETIKYATTQKLTIIDGKSNTGISKTELNINIDIPLKASIDVTKKWEDYSNINSVRPSSITLKVYRKIDGGEWKLLTEVADYELAWTDKGGDTWKAIISNLKRTDENGNAYSFKVEEQGNGYYNVTYSRTDGIMGKQDSKTLTITNTLKDAKISVTKKWNDYSNTINQRPDTIKFNVFRSTDNQTWEKLTENKHYKITWDSKEGDNWNATISQLLALNSEGKPYYFKVEEQELSIYEASYPNGKVAAYNEETKKWNNIAIENSLKKIDISGNVWLDGQTQIKPPVTADGKMEPSEPKLQNIIVYLYYKDPQTGLVNKIAETTTDAEGCYKFENQEIGYYYVDFEYDGINYENTIKVENGHSKAFEKVEDRKTFNGRFQTIEYGKSNDGTALTYDYSDNKSTLITLEDDKVKQEFAMNASTELTLYTANIENLNLGLVRRGIDIALSTDVANAEVNINGQKTNYTFNSVSDTDIITNNQSSNVSYNLDLYTSDYYYRKRDYVSNGTFKENNYTEQQVPEGTKTGEELKVYVTYELNLQNQSSKTTRINEVKYIFDEKYTFKQITDSSYSPIVSGNTITINGLSLEGGETKTLYLVFEVNKNEALALGNFYNKAEITSYSTDDGLIDVDSQPGNFMNDNQVEDDNDTAGGLTIKIPENTERKITGKVFEVTDSDNKQNVNDVIVQLVELKTVNGKVYEYIWQETVSGSGKGLRLNAAGTNLEEYTYTKADGTYEFIGFIPGDYIVRFIYGDGKGYGITGNVVKYNGQDYKSTEDGNYNSEWYNTSSYTQGASVARDNEARRLETMAYSVEIDASKGVLLKLLNNVTVDGLNETEKEVLVSTYNNLYDPDITEVTSEVINKLLTEQVLPNTWMCAETSKIKVAVDTDNITNTKDATNVNGINKVYVEEIPNINLGLELRPATKIELEKHITGFKLVAANGQTLVNAYIPDLSNPTDIKGIRDNVTILDTVWQYEVVPTEINTIVDGASLEFEYTLIVKNTGDKDYLSATLAEAYKNNTTADYITLLKNITSEIKGYMKAGTYRTTNIGTYLGNSYYTGATGANKVLTEVTNIRDYVNNDLKFIASGEDIAIDEPECKHELPCIHRNRILTDDYNTQEAIINTVLKTTNPTGKMENGQTKTYKITLGKNPISATGNLNFENYIAEVMSFTNAAGRRVMYYEEGELKTATPGNAEIIDHEHRDGKAHEIDEADTARIQIGAATGEDVARNYIIITTVIAGIVIIAAGAIVVKKYVIK